MKRLCPTILALLALGVTVGGCSRGGFETRPSIDARPGDAKPSDGAADRAPSPPDFPGDFWPADAQAGLIASTSSGIDVIDAPPSAVEGHQESADKIMLFAERKTVLAADLELDIDQPGQYKTAAAPGTVPAGTAVQSFMLHVDKENDQTTLKSFAGSVTFRQEILGLIISLANLKASDGVVGASETTYSQSASRGLEKNEVDLVELSADRRTVTLLAEVSGICDNVRIIVSSPLP